VREGGDARPTPDGPEVNEDDLALEVAELDGLAVETEVAADFRGLLADHGGMRIFLVLGGIGERRHEADSCNQGEQLWETVHETSRVRCARLKASVLVERYTPADSWSSP